MPRPLKIFQTHIGFYDLVIAAPSRKAAAEAWGVDPRLFAQGFAVETRDPQAVRAALALPGVVLKRQHGSTGEYKRDPEPPSAPKKTPRQKKAMAAARKAQQRKEAEEKKERPRSGGRQRSRRRRNWPILSARTPNCANAAERFRNNFVCAACRPNAKERNALTGHA
jgi:hypothetical protein